MDEPRVVLYCGDRNWTDLKPIRASLLRMKALGATRIVHGAARGADSIAAAIAADLFGSENVIPYKANWELGPVGGTLRNREMLATERPNWVIGFHNEIDRPKCGTRHMLQISQVASYVSAVYLFSHKDGWEQRKPKQEEIQYNLPLGTKG